MKFSNFFGILLKGLALVAVIGILILSIGVFGYSIYDIIKVFKVIIAQSAGTEEIILKALKSIDLVLLGVVFFVMGVGLFELFIGAIDNLPDWLVIKNIDELKSMLIKVVIVVMGVSFSGRVITWDTQTDLLGYGVGLGAVIFALSYFLKIKGKESTTPE